MDIYVGRQPIYNQKLELVGYELLFRNDNTNRANITDSNAATSDVIINSCLEIGLEKLVGNRLAYINIPYDFIVRQDELILPKKNTVLEILEDIKCDDDTLLGIKKLKNNGHTVALDDFILSQDNEGFLRYADIVKLDITQYDQQSLANAVEKLKTYQLTLLAEKIETQEEFEYCSDLGFDQFQGYFLSKPQIVKGKKIPNNKLNLLRLLASMQSDSITVSEQEKIISHDVALSYGLLRYINSPAFNLTKTIGSIRDAVMLLGMKNIKKWATVLSLSQLSDCPKALLLTSMIRARMCESLAKEVNCKQGDACFTAGLFSPLDAIMKTSMEEIMAHLPLSEKVSMALLSRQGDIGNILKLSVAWEQNQWDEIETPSIETSRVQALYFDAIEFGESTLSELSRAA